MRLFTLPCTAFIVLALSGCGDTPRLARVSGVLTFKGTPVPNVQLDFYPEAGRPSWGLTDAAGRFTLEYDPEHQGVLPGKHKVFAKMGPGFEKFPGERPTLSPEMTEFFDKYSAVNSPVVVEIQADTKEIALSWD